MKPHKRILIVVTQTPPRGLGMACSEMPGLPPRDVAQMAAELLRLGAEVRVLDQDTERLGERIVRRETRLWRADMVMLYAGGSFVAANPVPDASSIRRLLSGWSPSAVLVAAGPLAVRYAEELLSTFPDLAGALTSEVSAELAALEPVEDIPGMVVRDGDETRRNPPPSEPPPDVMPAWEVLPLDACAARTIGGARLLDVLCPEWDIDGTLGMVRHAAHRGGGRKVTFVNRDIAEDHDFVRELSRGMISAAPGMDWSVRVRADHLDPMIALTFANGGCREMLVCPPEGHHGAGHAPMDDATRSQMENAIEVARVTGMAVALEHVIGRPGHDRGMLSAWQRWYADRQILVHPHVRLLHAGDKGPGRPDLAEASERAGCWDNELTPRIVARAVRETSDKVRLAAGLAGA
jgi:hypothetical protein